MSNPIASETQPEICDKCKMELEPGTFHVGCIPQPDEPASDPSGKGAETAKEWLTSYLSQFPECIGSPECDGYLAGEEHEKGCPCFGLISPRYPAAHEVLEAYTASLRQQLSDRNAMYEGMLERADELAKKELTEAQGKVSQLEAEHKSIEQL